MVAPVCTGLGLKLKMFKNAKRYVCIYVTMTCTDPFYRIIIGYVHVWIYLVFNGCSDPEL